MNVARVRNAYHMTYCEFSSRLIGIRSAIESQRDQGEDKVKEVTGPLPISYQ